MAVTLPNILLESPVTGDSNYPSSITTSLANIDAHDHTTNKGVQIPTAGIANLAVTTAKIADSNVTTLKIADSNVTTAKIAALNVTRAKLEALGQQLSASCGAIDDASAVYVDATNLSVTITTSGRPVFLALVDDGSGNSSFIGVRTGGIGTGEAIFSFDRGGAAITNHSVKIITGSASTASLVPSSSLNHIDVVAAGTYTYKLKYKLVSGGGTLLNFAKLIAYEL